MTHYSNKRALGILTKYAQQYDNIELLYVDIPVGIATLKLCKTAAFLDGAMAYIWYDREKGVYFLDCNELGYINSGFYSACLMLEMIKYKMLEKSANYEKNCQRVHTV